MFTVKTKSEPTTLEVEIERVLTLMSDESPTTDKYAQMADQLTKLYEMKKTNSSNRLSKDTLVAAACNLAGIVLIMNKERLDVITTKALGFVTKSKL